MQDLRFACRLIRRHPLLTAAAALTVAFGVGANTAIVSVLNTVLLNPLGLRDSTRVMAARVSVDKLNLHHVETSAVEFREIQEMTDTFGPVAAMEGRWWTALIGGEATRLTGRAVTLEFFDVFHERPVVGRFFTTDDRESVVLSNSFWRSAFGADPNVLGRVVVLDDQPYRIVGVADASFRLPPNAQAWTALAIASSRFGRRGNNMNLTVLARLKSGVTARQAADRVNRYVAALKAQPGDFDMTRFGYSIDLDSFSAYVAGDLRRPLLLLWAAAVVVLLAGCANVAGLLLIRGIHRKREIAIRISVGATRSRVIRQLLIESMLLGAIGGLCGLALARVASSMLTRLSIPGKQVLELVSLDGRLLLYGFLLALFSGLLFGLAPALQLLRESQAAGMGCSPRQGYQDIFVTTQVAGAFVLVVITALLLRSLWAVERLRPGFDPSNLTTAFFTKPKNDPGFLDRLEGAVRSSPGVESAALAYPLPFAAAG